jgi:hypothetical protein
VYKTRLNLIYDPTAAILTKNHTFSKALYGDILHRISPKSIKKYGKVHAEIYLRPEEKHGRHWHDLLKVALFRQTYSAELLH